MSDGFSFHIPTGDGDEHLMLTNPCVVDCNTEIGRITLILDRQYPRFLFVQIMNEWRKCILLEPQLTHFNNDMEIFDFLRRFQATTAFNKLIEEEKNLDAGWEAL
ncbi:MAG: hypothetical protein P9L94_16300 [Candidatus Hinthialibacter antarcticus]|nr:hypothetical protein [Candidatus Hinthialibacter antarcticus]